MSSVHCRFINGECYDFVGKCFSCPQRKKVLERERKRNVESEAV